MAKVKVAERLLLVELQTVEESKFGVYGMRQQDVTVTGVGPSISWGFFVERADVPAFLH